MKYSIYNSIIHVDKDNLLLYNANSDKFLIITQKSKEDIDKGVDFLKAENTKLFQKLQETKAIVSDSTDEVAELQNKIQKILEDDTCFELHINPTLDCNFNCWYCYEDHIKGSFMNKEILKATQEFIGHTLNRKGLKNFHLSFFGGEPLLYFKRIALPLIHFALEQCKIHNIAFSSHFTSNGFLVNDYTLECLDGINVDFQITLDGNETTHNQTRFLKNGMGSYSIICRNIIAIAEHRHNVCLRINYTLQNINSILSKLHSFENISRDVKKYINVDFQRVWQDTDKDKASADDLHDELYSLFKKFKDAGFCCSFHKVQNTVENPCYGDKKNNLLINYDGKVFSCTARKFTSDNCEGILSTKGKIIWKGNLKERRIHSKFSRKECHQCVIAPICGGCCTQKNIEMNKVSGCLRGLSQDDKKQVILDRFEFMFLNNNN